ncbi:uncharacterized membrane protein HdeD (DUF308 family) [Kineosphaera limosa]|uniref:HdeD family acid-resistance protein n=1 Tax=Kineosphaera limosa NBRC 100340 TaxID=1184609 RepID=K6WMJ0_9MICO|nr:HdeD family acid-resistance protein [Kineosphaera limosa]NYE00513.1 uncharacterized membrane protein HdeD (DUF308 family) [Kineosphaera limosa]GAB95021.1 hypothetical protein KILIM_015_00820 [Kineosphaera limosa NBRC 100340]
MNALAQRSSTWLMIMGGVTIVFGIVAMVWPFATAFVLILMWGWYALIDGVLALVGAFRKEMAGSRAFLLITGVLGVIAGLLAIFQPVSSAVALTWVLGIWLIVRGVMELIAGFRTPGGAKWWLIIGGVLWLIAGGVLAANPGAGALTFALWLGFFAVAWGITLLISGFVLRRESNSAGQVDAAAS